LGKEFEVFARKVGLQTKTVDVEQYAPLPAWAKTEALRAGQIMNVAAAALCEGALNPVALISIPTCRMVSAQSFGTVGLNSTLPSVARSLSQNLPGLGSMQIAVAPAMAGMGLGQTAAIVGGVGGGVAVASGSGSSTRSPASP
jgi:hypothetical protein